MHSQSRFESYNQVMQLPRHISWSRIAAESVAIIASILLAFAIDAWWEERGERKLETALLADLQSDFRASQAHLEAWLAGNRRTLEDNTLFVDRVRASQPDGRFNAELGWVVSVIGVPTYDPTDATFRAALASGRLELLSDYRLRSALATWRQVLEDTREDEEMVRKLVVEKVNPALARQMRLGEAFEFDLLTGRFGGADVPEPGRIVSLQASRDLEAALAERLFHQTFVVSGLQELRLRQAEVLQLLQAGAGSHEDTN